MALDDLHSNLLFFLRWIHILAGIIWIGMLYFFNFVNAPFQAGLPKEMKPTVNPALLGRALWWFRWGAMTTFVIGWVLFSVKYMSGGMEMFRDSTTGSMTQRAMWILFGAGLGSIMWFNVWFVIWPAQKQILGWVKASQAPAEMPALMKRAALFSKINTYLSGPMLFGMIAPNNYSSINAVTLIVCVGFAELVIWGMYKHAGKVGHI